MLKRRQLLQAKLTPQQLLLLSKPTDIHYYTGFEFLVPEEREAFAILTASTSYLIYGAFSPLPPNVKGLTLKTGCSLPQLVEHLKALFTAEKLTEPEIIFDAADLRVVEHQALEPLARLTPLEPQLVWQQRLYKDNQEVTALKKAGQIASQAFERVRPLLKPGMSEQLVRQLLDRTMEDLGSERPAFPTIVAFGSHGALPHHQPSVTALLEPETPVLLDFGATFEGYRSDMTRSFWFGSTPTENFITIEKLVHQAYQAAFDRLSQSFQTEETTTATTFASALEKAAAAALAKDIDQAARTTITEAGYGKNFIHTTGHGVGLEIHEPPSLSWRNDQVLKTNMVLTIEPGIYLEGEFGYRYENTVLITEDGLTVMTE